MRHVQADRISCYNRPWAERAGYWETTSFFEEEGREAKIKPGTTIFYDSVTSEPLFQAPVGRYFTVFVFLSSHVLLRAVVSGLRGLRAGECGSSLWHNSRSA